jgi:hypothetical protein
MFNKGNVVIFNTTVEPKNSGTRIIKASDKLVNIDELRNALANDDKFVVIRNHVSKWSDVTECQNFINTDRLVPEVVTVGDETIEYEATYTFTHWGRSLSTATNRKIVMSFRGKGKDAELRATYYSS